MHESMEGPGGLIESSRDGGSALDDIIKAARDDRMERIATKAMAAMIATGNYTSRDRWEVAKSAKAFADAMIVTLEEE